ncbi:APC family permease [Micromonosporaceae bacterium Da 78-11]
MTLTTTRGVALYIGALLGPGLLVLPGLASAIAGPASILAWAALLLLSGLFAVVFAALGIALPSGDGVAAYTRAGLGGRAGRVVSWAFLAGVVSGTPVVCFLGAGYLVHLLGGGREAAAVAGGILLLAVLAVTCGGVRASAAVQLGLVGLLLLVVAVAIGAGLTRWDPRHWSPFAPHGWSAIGTAATPLMLSFVGWEAIAPLTARFAAPRKQLPTVIGIAFAVTAVLYLALAGVTVAALGPTTTGDVPLAGLLALTFGTAGPVVAAGAALLLTLGTTNAYLTGAGALARSLAPDRTRPDRTPVPPWLLAVLPAAGLAEMCLLGSGAVSTATAIGVPTTLFLVVYLGCTVAGVRILPGPARHASAVAAAAVLVVLCFSGGALIPAAVVVLVTAAWPTGVRRLGTAPGGNESALINDDTGELR